MKESEDLIIGIDLGTTNTCAACFRDGNLQVLENGDGGFTTPSYVFFQNNTDILVGKHAALISANKPQHGIYGIKRLIGRQYHEVEKKVDSLPYIVKNDDGNPTVFIEKFQLSKSPEYITSQILRKIRKDTSAKLGQKITKAVVTVPAHFNVSQRKSTLCAAQEAGFEVLKLLSEPTAAALNYQYEKRVEDVKGKYCLVYDLGGGTFDVSIVERNGQNMNIVGVDGDSYLGGQDFDDLLVNYCRTELKQDKPLDKRALRRLINACKDAKEILSTSKETSVILEGFQGREVVDIPLTRTQFNQMAQHLFQKTIDVVDRCIKKSRVPKNHIDQVILAGGSSKIREIQNMLREYFDGKVLNHTLHPEHCVAEGAALQAAMLSKNPRQEVTQFEIKEVTASSLGIADVSHRMDVIIEKNVPIPMSKSTTHATISNNQKLIKLKVYEGERLDARKNIFLGTLKITNLTAAPPGQCKITVTMNIDNNGILTVTAREKHRDNIRNLEIALVRDGTQTPERESNEDDVDDKRFDEFAKMKQYLITYCEAVIFNLEEVGLRQLYKTEYNECQTVQNIITRSDVGDAEKVTCAGKKIKKMCDPIVKKHNFKNIPPCDAVTEEKLKKSLEDSDDEDFRNAPIRVKDMTKKLRFPKFK